MTKVESVFKKDINLLPEHIFAEKRNVTIYHITLLCVSCVVILMGLFLAAGVQLVDRLASKNTSIEAEIEMVQDIETVEKDLANLKGVIDAKKEYEKSIDELNSNMVKVLDLLEKIMPSDVSLSALVDGVTNTGERTITIEGNCSTKAILADFETKLRESDMFFSVFVPEITQAVEGDSRSDASDDPKKATGFSIICIFNNTSDADIAEQDTQKQDDTPQDIPGQIATTGRDGLDIDDQDISQH